MCNTSDVPSFFRSEKEISVPSIESFYGNNERLFDDAIDAVVMGCVTEYSYDNEEKKFVGIVTSFEGSKAYEVEV